MFDSVIAKVIESEHGTITDILEDFNYADDAYLLIHSFVNMQTKLYCLTYEAVQLPFKY